MSEKPLDRRVVRTRTMLRDALLELIDERGYDAINITDITERADLRRATFYLHYDDKDQLLLAALESTFDELVAGLEPIMRGDALGGKTNVETYRVMFAHIAAHHALYKAILTSGAAAVITRRIREYLAGHILRGLQIKLEAAVVPEVVAQYIAGAELALITWWLEQDMPHSVDEMARMAQALTLHGAAGVVDGITA